MAWLRTQAPERVDDIGKLSRALLDHEDNLAEGEVPPDSWVKVASRIARGVIHGAFGKDKLRRALDDALAEFRACTLPHEAKEQGVALQEAAE